MKGCWVYTLTYNCIDMAPHFWRYHKTADRIVVYDNGSTDGTREYFESRLNTEVRPYQGSTDCKLRDDIHADIKNSCWKEARGKANWVIVMDFDEFLYHPKLDEKLAEYKQKGITVPLTSAYEMAAPSFPEHPVYLADVVKSGRRNDLYSKLIIFDPNAVVDIGYGPGGHDAKPVGQIVYSGTPYWDTIPVPPYPPLIIQRFHDDKGEWPPPNELKILHYRFVGLDRVERMWEQYKKRMSQINLSNGWGRHYFLPREEQERIYSLLVSQSEKIVE